MLALILLSGFHIAQSQRLHKLVADKLVGQCPAECQEDLNAKENTASSDKDDVVCPGAMLTPAFKDCMAAALSTAVASLNQYKLRPIMLYCSPNWIDGEPTLEPFTEMYLSMERLATETSQKFHNLHLNLSEDAKTLHSLLNQPTISKEQVILGLKELKLVKIIESDGELQGAKIKPGDLNVMFVKDANITACGEMLKDTYKQVVTYKSQRSIDQLNASGPPREVMLSLCTMNKMAQFFYEFYTFQILVANTWSTVYKHDSRPQFSPELIELIQEFFMLNPLFCLSSRNLKKGIKIIDKLTSPTGLPLFYNDWHSIYTERFKKALLGLMGLKNSKVPMTKHDEEQVLRTIKELLEILIVLANMAQEASSNLLTFYNEVKEHLMIVWKVPTVSLIKCLKAGQARGMYGFVDFEMQETFKLEG
ncbi:hypothetical protein NEHOM01_1823 [Nematocida homosporus]|uniref:uncharacterized protein n=1 Tax=Nematocida homosporus TaxID=1912981 RepID=UPI00221FAE68|nr:uncharacterized protein NEHOM01_1823 [Nematocida homosporus]KAI5186957.1 hypothetical protein NEHOM01_1823 [Nematocida homosporus]